MNQDPAPDRQDHQINPPGGGFWSRWSSLRIVLWALLLLGGNFLLQVSLFSLLDELFLPVAVAAVLAIGLPCHIAARSCSGTLASEFQLGPTAPANLFWSVLIAVGSLLPTSLLAELSVHIQPVPESWITFFQEHLPSSPAGIALAVVTVVIFAPLGEELLFRGILHRLASRLWGPVPAAVISALTFALVHGEPWYLFGLFGLGLLLAFIYESTRSVTACVVTHGVHNAISFSFLMQEDAAESATTAQGLPDEILLAGSLLLLVFSCYRLWRRNLPGPYA